MKNLNIYKVYPAIPESLEFLDYLARNLWWCWNHEAIELFHRIDPARWEKSGKNPVVFLTYISQRRFRELENDESFLGHLGRVKDKFEYMFSTDSRIKGFDLEPKETIAYFSMEFGLHESLPLFAGGLGVLAGDHLKAASSLGLSLTAVGLMFREGYFQQYLDHTGWQQETYPINDVFELPLQKVQDQEGKEILIRVPGPEGDMIACIWLLKVGRIKLYLLDTNLAENPQSIRDITSRLYASHGSIRVAQEILLGIGGIKALTAMDIFPAVCHMNEGHCAFAGLERISMVMDRHKTDFDAAFQIARRTSLFTTHTPVAAGHDEFENDLVRPYITHYAGKFHVSEDVILSWGKVPDAGNDDKFSMFILGAKMCSHINGVSRLHGQVARKMWRHLWPNRYEEEVPISHITNGVHVCSYLSRHKNALLERYLAHDWAERMSDARLITRIETIEDSDLWHVHELDRSNLVRKCRELLITQYERRNAPRTLVDEVAGVLDPHVLTICFARRFATYKRASLILSDIRRLSRMINDDEFPVQFIFAGKAHPNDTEGKDIIQQIVEFASRHDVRHRVAFIENYDINIARYMVQGCDVWLNTPRRPMEACGTSGMKAAANGALNLSILDGWWCEGYRGDRGWNIGNGHAYDDPVYQDDMESQTLYNILENDVIPTYYERTRGNPPLRWITMMKESMKMAISEFSSDRMVRDYAVRFYVPASTYFRRLTQDNAQKAGELAIVQARLTALWKDIRLSRPQLDAGENFKVGDRFRIGVEVFLGQLEPGEVKVEIYHGRVTGSNVLAGARSEAMELEKTLSEGTYLYSCAIPCLDSGRFGYTARVIPEGDEVLANTPGLMTWAED